MYCKLHLSVLLFHMPHNTQECNYLRCFLVGGLPFVVVLCLLTRLGSDGGWLVCSVPLCVWLVRQFCQFALRESCGCWLAWLHTNGVVHLSCLACSLRKRPRFGRPHSVKSLHLPVRLHVTGRISCCVVLLINLRGTCCFILLSRPCLFSHIGSMVGICCLVWLGCSGWERGSPFSNGIGHPGKAPGSPGAGAWQGWGSRGDW